MILLKQQRTQSLLQKWFMMLYTTILMFVVVFNDDDSTTTSSSSSSVFVTAQPVYISQICPTSKHHLLSLVPADDDIVVNIDDNDKNPPVPVYKIYDGDDGDDDEAGNDKEDDVLLFRECTCPRPTGHPNPIACPLDSRFCAIPTDTSIPVMCYAEDASVMVVRNIWPLMCLWYLCFILFVCCSYKGRQAVLYCFSKCLPQININLVDRMLQRQRRQWTLNFWSSAVRAARNNNNNNNNEEGGNGNENDEQQQQQQQQQEEGQEQAVTSSPPPRALELKIKRFDFSMINNGGGGGGEIEDENYDEDDHCCTICFVPLEEGDRIGDLPSCNHLFHVECLKIWLQRKNTCPLCAAPMAAPSNKYNHQHHRVGGGGGGGNNNSILASLGMLSSPSSLSSQAIESIISPTTQTISPTSTTVTETPISPQVPSASSSSDGGGSDDNV